MDFRLFRGNYLLAAVLVVAALFVYANALGNQMFWDDDDGILKNAYIKDWRFFDKYFTEDLIAGAGLDSSYWRPLLAIIYSLEWHIWGAWSLGYHATNIILHIGAGLFVFRLLQLLALSSGVAFLTALLFLIHPLATEAVTYVSGRADPLYTLLLLAALILHVKWRRALSDESPLERLWNLRFLSGLMFALALMSKEVAVVFVGLAPLTDIYLNRTQLARSLRQFFFTELRVLLPYIVILAGYVLVRFLLPQLSNTIDPYASVASPPLVPRILTFFKSLTIYWSLLVWPSDLHMERTLAVAGSLFEPLVIGGILGTVALFGVGLATWRTRPWIIFGIVWFYIGMMRMWGIVPTGGLMYEHWIYFASIGFWLVLISMLHEFSFKIKSRPVRAAAAILGLAYVIVLGARTHERNSQWRDPISLYSQTLRFSPAVIRVWNNLGMAYADAGGYDEAIKSYEKAIALDIAGVAAPPHHNLGNAYAALGKRDEAIKEYQRALEIDPNFFFSAEALRRLQSSNF